MTFTKWNDENIAVLRALVKAGLTAKVIGERLGLNPQTVSNKMSKLGIQAPRHINMLTWDEDMTNRLLRMWKNGHSSTECARFLSRHYSISFTRNMVIGRLHRVGAPPRAVDVRKPTYMPKPTGVRRPPNMMTLTEAARVAGVGKGAMLTWALGDANCRKTPAGWLIPAASVGDFHAWVKAGVARKVQESAPQFHALAANAPPPKPQIAGKPLADLNNCECHWPMNEWDLGHGDEAIFCAAETIEGFPYCATHGARAFNPSPHSKRSGIRETNIKRRQPDAINLDDAVIGIDGRMEAA